MICLVHHADALPPDVDFERPLSSLGLAQAAEVAAAIHLKGFSPAAIWHSGKLRARQTAEACWRATNPFAEFKLVRGLRPDDAAGIIADAIAGEARDVILVGHMPHLPALRSLLTGIARDFPLHGAVALAPIDEEGRRWEERWTIVPAYPASR